MNITEKMLATIKDIAKEMKIKEDKVTWQQIAIKLANEILNCSMPKNTAIKHKK